MSCINQHDFYYKDRFNYRHSIKIDCGSCLNCLSKKVSQLEFLAKKDLLYKYRNGQGASFVTLTYDDSHLPVNDKGFVTLRRSDVQKFIKNMRRQMEYYNSKIPFRYIYCGELGDDSARPHYHIIFIGLSDSQVKKYTRKLWKHGLCDVGPLSQGGLRYVLKYISKCHPDKQVKELRDSCGVQSPFVYHSIGLGKDWIINNMDKIVNDGFTFNLNGKIQLFPKYVMRFVSVHTGVNYIPYVKSFIAKEATKIRNTKNITFNQYQYENAYISYKQKVFALRSKGKAVTDETLNKAYVRPFHSFDRKAVSKLASKADLAQIPF